MGARRSAAQSRFGLRMIVVFAACSLLPMLVFATFAYLRTREQLEADAVQALRRETKEASMRFIERLALSAQALAVAGGIHHHVVDLEGLAFDAFVRRPASALPLGVKERRDFEQGRQVLFEDPADPGHPLQMAVRTDEGDAFVGLLRSDALFEAESSGDTTRRWIEDARGEILFVADADGRTVELLAALPHAASRARLVLEAPDGDEVAMIWPVFLGGHFEHPGFRIGLAVRHDAVLEPLAEFESAFLVAVALGLLGSVAIGLHQVRRRIGPLEGLMRVAQAVEAGDYSARAEIGSGDEFDDLARSFNAMTSEVAQHVANLQQLTIAGATMLKEPTVDSVAAHLVEQALELTGADLGVLFRVESGEAERSQTARAVAACRGAARDPVPTGDLVGLELAVPEVHEGAPLLLESDHDRAAHAPLWAALERIAQRPIEGLLVLPLRTSAEAFTTLLVLGTHRAAAGAPWQGRSFHAVRILSDQAAVAIRVADLVANLRALFEGVIHLTVQAIDEKSPYTGDHCRRVPVLTEQIADAVERADWGPLKDFTLSSAERYELRIAALLHDCGKVATPVHVMDKATKLETIMDRIEVVRGRAEILRRDFELASMRRIVDEAGLAGRLDEDAHRELVARLDDDLAFVEKCNIGGEFMDPAAKARIDEIDARYAWRDRAGEHRRLLTDRDRDDLKIGRGTLNESERGIIEGHASTTIRLLERLPFPPEMARVPYIAGSHHERLDGTGYPNGLAAADLNVQARILGLADVFEALTAKDRPYKPGRTLSQTLRILQSMVAEGHIDGELLDVMLKSKVHLRYAAEYMDPEQIDGVHREEFEEWTAPWDAPHPAH
jgi:HD-GYP domain-containing protein (c-di-GMP phosphodiesterase class II)